MAGSVIFIGLLVAMLASILASIIIHVAIVEGINRKHAEGSRISYFSRDLLSIFKAHRELYPKSRLRQFLMISIALEAALGFGFILRLALS